MGEGALDRLRPIALNDHTLGHRYEGATGAWRLVTPTLLKRASRSAERQVSGGTSPCVGQSAASALATLGVGFGREVRRVQARHAAILETALLQGGRVCRTGSVPVWGAVNLPSRSHFRAVHPRALLAVSVRRHFQDQRHERWRDRSLLRDAMRRVTQFAARWGAAARPRLAARCAARCGAMRLAA